MIRLLSLLVVSTLQAVAQTAPPKPEHKERGPLVFKEITALPWADSWKKGTLGNPRLISQKEDLAQPTGLPPVWHCQINGPDNRTGYLMWDSSGGGRLLEFALDDPKQDEKAVPNIPPLQQFALPDAEGGPIASGCVPTSAASLLAYWINREEKEKPDLKKLTLTLRKQLRMFRFPDTDGFTENGMALAGALPQAMAAALEKEAQARELGLTVRHLPFSMDRFRKEIAAGYPTLLSCTIRVPHKPELSWGHAVVGLAATKADGVDLVGIHDNFYPTKNSGTIRWIRSDAFRSLTAVRPIEE
jgi:hypothetical protein